MIIENPAPGAPDRLITERSTAEILGVSVDTLRRLNRRGEGPTRRKILPRRVGYKLSEVEAYRDGKLRSAVHAGASAFAPAHWRAETIVRNGQSGLGGMKTFSTGNKKTVHWRRISAADIAHSLGDASREGRTWRCMSTAKQAKPDAAGRRRRANPHQSRCVGGFDGIAFGVRVRQGKVRRGVGSIGRLVPTPANTKRLRSLTSETKPRKIARDQNMKGATQQRAKNSFSDFAGGFPHSIEAEQGLLGATLTNNEAYSFVSRLIETGDFFEPIHQEIYRLASDLISVGKLATPITLKNYLPADLDIAGVSLGRYLARLCAEATTVINAPDYAKTICDLKHRRDLMVIGEELQAIAAGSRVDFSPDMLVHRAIERLDEIVTARSETRVPRVAIGAAAEQAVEHLSAVGARGGKIGGITTGLSRATSDLIYDSDDPAPYWKMARGELAAIRRRQWLMPPEPATSRMRQGIREACDKIG